MLTQKEVNFRWTPETETFVVKQYAEYLKPKQITLAVIQNFREYIDEDITTHGMEKVGDFLIQRIRGLNPRAHNIATDYMELFENCRDEFLANIQACYLSQRKNRLVELDTLYEEVAKHINAGGENLKGDVEAALSIIREARKESAPSSVDLTASQNGGTTLTLRSNIESLSTDQIKALMSEHERGDQISLPPPTESDSDEPAAEPNPTVRSPSGRVTVKKRRRSRAKDKSHQEAAD